MKLLFDFFPIVLFFVAYKLYGIYVATAVAIFATALQIGMFWFKNRRFETMHLVTFALIFVMGGATLILQDEMFIKWKPSVINWLFAVILIASSFIGKEPLMKKMMGGQIQLEDVIWNKINLLWAGFFAVVGFLNIYVVYNFDTDTWVDFKLFGIMGLTVVFIILQALYLARFMPEEAEEEVDR